MIKKTIFLLELDQMKQKREEKP